MLYLRCGHLAEIIIPSLPSTGEPSVWLILLHFYAIDENVRAALTILYPVRTYLRDGMTSLCSSTACRVGDSRITHIRMDLLLQ